MKTSLTPKQAESNRDNAAVNLAARHLCDRPGRHIVVKVIATGLPVWQIESQTEPGKVYTITTERDGWPADTCDCPDHLWRHTRCKHLRAVSLLQGETPAPAPSLADERARRDARSEELEQASKSARKAARREWREEV